MTNDHRINRSKTRAVLFSHSGPSVAHDTDFRRVFRRWEITFFSIGAAFALVLAGFVSTPRAQADDVYTVIVKKQEEKKKSRWSLSEWLATKEKIRLMDMWLAMNSPSPYEFFIAGDYRNGNASTGTVTGMGFSAAAYATIFGLEGQYESLGSSSKLGLFHLRVFGFQDQGTHITFQLGLKSQDDASGVGTVRSPFWGGRVAACFNRFFGIEALIRHYFDSTGGASGIVAAANRYEGSAFIDFSFLRIYGTYFSEPSFSRNGVLLGGKIYF